MKKLLVSFFFIILVTLLLLVIYISYIGINTDKFDGLIKDKANEVNQNVKLEFQKTKIHLNPKELNLIIRLQNPKILVKNNEIDLSKLDLFLSLKSLFSSDFLLERSEVAFEENDIKDLTKITEIFLPKFINKQLNKIFHKGVLEGRFTIPFEKDGSLGADYGFSGKISESTINLTKKFSIKNLTAKIKKLEDNNRKSIEILFERGLFYDLDLTDTKINLDLLKNETNIDLVLKTKGKLNSSQIKKVASLLGKNISAFSEINGIVDLNTKINFNFSDSLKIKNLSYSVEGNIPYFEIHTNENKIIKNYLPKYDPKITIKEATIKLINSKSKYMTELNGFLKTNKNFDNFNLKNTYDSKNKIYYTNGNLDLTNSIFNISRLNFIKPEGKKAKLSFKINFILNKFFIIENLEFLDDKNKIYLSDIKLNKNFELVDLKKIEVKTSYNEKRNNDFSISKSKKIDVTGKLFDAQPLLKSLYKKSDKKIFSKNFSSGIKINLDKTITGTNDDILNLSVIAQINKGSYDMLSSKGNFSENEIVEISIYKHNDSKKTLQVISDRARPFVKNFNFIKGFEGGKLVYDSIISKEDSNSNLLITDFKVSKVPALAKLLTLASLQGIADTLSGEGIRFESFEMKTNSKGNLLNIEDALAMGPAISILLEGYVDKGRTVSLKGTLVPATKLNSIIASIPLVGDILVGKKIGEGVVGVSFKMKGPPKDIKTTVNPIKTLTPRFIVRAVEKMKKKNEDVSK